MSGYINDYLSWATIMALLFVVACWLLMWWNND